MPTSTAQLILPSYAAFPQLLILFILIGSAGPYFDSSLASVGSNSQISANRLSFFSLCFYAPNSWGAAASDFWVYYPENTSKVKTFLLTYTGLTLSFCLVYLLGIGLASGIATNSSWADAYAVSSGALINEGFAPLRDFGKFCSVIVALGLISNSVPGIYSAALGCQMLGRFCKIVPRWIWVIVLVVISLVCALAGRNSLFVVFQNLLALMGYWLMIMICIVAEEHALFRWRKGVGFDWTAWEDRKRLPIGVAALLSFAIGWVGAVLGMYQVWFTGPLAKLVGETGADVGMWVGCGFALLVFPPLRVMELKFVGR
jgi:purine-cytosine permease-like protein